MKQTKSGKFRIKGGNKTEESQKIQHPNQRLTNVNRNNLNIKFKI